MVKMSATTNDKIFVVSCYEVEDWLDGAGRGVGFSSVEVD